MVYDNPNGLEDKKGRPQVDYRSRGFYFVRVEGGKSDDECIS